MLQHCCGSFCRVHQSHQPDGGSRGLSDLAVWHMMTKAIQSENTLASLKSAFFQRADPRGLRIMNCLVKLNLVTALIKRTLLMSTKFFMKVKFSHYKQA